MQQKLESTPYLPFYGTAKHRLTGDFITHHSLPLLPCQLKALLRQSGRDVMDDLLILKGVQQVQLVVIDILRRTIELQCFCCK